MAINLKKGQRIDLVKHGAAGGEQQLTEFCVGCNWGAITRETSGGFLGLGRKQVQEEVDLDLSCVMVNAKGELADYVYSPEYRHDFLSHYGMPDGKLDSADRALHHSGDDRSGDTGGDDGLDNEIITVNLSKVAPNVDQIFFFLNICGKKDDEVFSSLPYASIRMYEGTPSKVKEVFATYNVAELEKCSGMKAMIMGKLYRREGTWKFGALGEAYEDKNLCLTIRRILKDYAK